MTGKWIHSQTIQMQNLDFKWARLKLMVLLITARTGWNIMNTGESGNTKIALGKKSKTKLWIHLVEKFRMLADTRAVLANPPLVLHCMILHPAAWYVTGGAGNLKLVVCCPWISAGSFYVAVVNVTNRPLLYNH